MRSLILAGLAATSFLASGALAQDASTDGGTSFRGIRIEGNIGGDRFRSLDTHDTKLGYGGSIGFDGVIADKIVIGPEGSYWRERHGAENCISGTNGGTVCNNSGEEFGAAVRIGYLVTPKLLVFGKGGYVNNRQHTNFDAPTGLLYANGQIYTESSFARHGSTDGYQAGGGVEFSLTDMFFVDGQYVYSRYQNDTSRQRAMLGVGVRFK